MAHHFVDCHYNSGFHTIEYVKTFSQLKDQFDSRPSSEQDNHIEERAHNDGYGPALIGRYQIRTWSNLFTRSINHSLQGVVTTEEV